MLPITPSFLPYPIPALACLTLSCRAQVRVTPMRTEVIIRATRTQNVLGEPAVLQQLFFYHTCACTGAWPLQPGAPRDAMQPTHSWLAVT